MCVSEKTWRTIFVYYIYSQLYTHNLLQQLNVKQSQSSGDKETVTFTGQVLMTQLQLKIWLMLNLTLKQWTTAVVQRERTQMAKLQRAHQALHPIQLVKR